MKKILAVIIFAVIALSCLSAQEVVYYNSMPTLQWDDNGTFSNGDPYLPSDTIEYEVYLWNRADGDITAQPIGNLALFATVETTSVTLSFPSRYEYAVAVRAKVTQADGAVVYSDLSYSVNEPPETALNPFYYAPNVGTLIPLSPYNLRDSGM